MMKTKKGCANLKYIITNYNDAFRGGWSYSAARKQLTLICDEDGEMSRDDDFEVIVHEVLELAATKVLLRSPEDDQTELVKK